MRTRALSAIALVPLLLAGCNTTPSQNGSGTASPQQTVAASATPATSATSPVSAAHPDPLLNKGIGPVSSVTLGPIDKKLVAEGEKLFKLKCAACHKMDKRRVGPPLGGVTQRRSPEWIMNMALNPGEMLKNDPIAKELLAEYATQMADQNLTEQEARALLEYLRTKENKDENSKEP